MHKNFFNPSWVLNLNFVHLYCCLNFLKNNLLFAYRPKVDQSKTSNDKFLSNFEMDKYHTHTHTL
jgi:N-dimethylarginine dimethylaminohydrolase